MHIETTPVVFKVFFNSVKKKKFSWKLSIVNIQKSLHISLVFQREHLLLQNTPTSISLFIPDCCITPSTILISCKLGVEMSKQFLVKTF